ncbi:8479_t:CDS:2 [Cetraspora pellucida]|uniref:8479_t:CDS:1 n=1 Tax=Cetraspora pellucida TaxID=1433469 RepID=A0ACA9JXT5_9GLOM|nr:8479_t:CDS:2 [Cetraspora pellucida]
MLPKGKIADIGYMFGIGVFHSGVEIYDKEYNFGGHDFDTTGVFVMKPRIGPPNVTFKDSVLMGHTSLSREDVKNVIDGLSKEWSGNSYNLLTRNCNHFTSELCNILVGKPAPSFVYFTPQFTFILTHNFSMEPLLNEYDQKTSAICNNAIPMESLDRLFFQSSIFTNSHIRKIESQKSENKCVVPNDWIEAPDAESGKVFKSVSLSILIN